MMNKLFKRLGLKDQYGWEETSVVGLLFYGRHMAMDYTYYNGVIH